MGWRAPSRPSCRARRTRSRKSGWTRKTTHDERCIDSIKAARGSAGDEIWDAGPEADIPIEGDDEDELLGPEEARRYRGVAARLNYIAPDRPDIAYAVKEAARRMSAPKASAPNYYELLRIASERLSELPSELS